MTTLCTRGPATARLAGLLVLLLVASGCSIRTAGAPTGELELVAVFDDIKNLVPGHAVRVGDVEVGSVRATELVDRRAEVTLSIVDGRSVPQGTVAVIDKTSLLGEHFVELRFPDGFRASDGAPLLSSGDRITDTMTFSDIEEVSEQAIEILGAIATDDLDAVVEALAEGIGGRGGQLNSILADVSVTVDAYAQESDRISAALDGLGDLAGELAAGTDELDRFLDELAVASGTLADQRERLVATADDLSQAARAVEDDVITPHGERLGRILRDLQPVARDLAANRALLDDTVDALQLFAARIVPSLSREGEFQVWSSLVRANPALEPITDPLGDVLDQLPPVEVPADPLLDPIEDLLDGLPDLDLPGAGGLGGLANPGTWDGGVR